MATSFTLPEPRTTPLRVNPQVLVINGPWKVGKTSSVAALCDLLLELREGGADYVAQGRIMQIADAQQLIQVLDYAATQRKAGKPICNRLGVDDLGTLDDWLFDLALANFKKSPLGGGKLADLRNITDLPSGSGDKGSPGWSWYWEELSMMFNKIILAANEVVIVSNIRDKVIKKESGDVTVEDIDVTGSKARRLLCGQSSAVGFMFRRRNGAVDELVLSFKTSDPITAGSHAQHLTGREFVLARTEGGSKPVFDWSAVFLPDVTNSNSNNNQPKN